MTVRPNQAMRHLLRAALPLLAWISGPIAAQMPPLPTDARLQAAYQAWDRGDYEAALEGYLAVLNGRDGPQFVEEIALLTGELYEVGTLATDAIQNLRVSPNGRYLVYEARASGAAVTRVVDLAVPDRAPTLLPGAGAVFIGDRTVAYLSPGAPVPDRELRIRSFPEGFEERINLQGWIPRVGNASVLGILAGSPDGEALYVLGGRSMDGPPTAILRVDISGTTSLLPTAEGGKSGLLPIPGGRYLIYTETLGLGPGATTSLVLYDVAAQRGQPYPGRSGATVTPDGGTLAFIGREGPDYLLEVVALDGAAPSDPLTVFRSPMPMAAPAFSPSGELLAFQGRPEADWEIFLTSRIPGSPLRQITSEIQHDLAPRFLDERRILAAKGEARHRRSYLYDTETGAATKLFHNNTVRTIAPEYEGHLLPDGSGILILADRDGDTISPERGVYLLDLEQRVSLEALRDRLEGNLAAERDLRDRGRATFAPIEAEVREITESFSVDSISRYGEELFAFGSKFITQPGNAAAIAHLEARLRGWGYEPELQWFEPRPGIRTANVIARLPGTVDPALVYVASSHFDSVEQGPGADDNSSGTSALLEAARVMRAFPQPATIEFAFFTGEEAGLLGSREYVRLAVERGKGVVGALNNDMIGWTNDHRLDNTIRYSNSGIRDIQHAAAFLFSDLITYDSHYYQNTDAAAYFEAYGDIVGGIGSHPVLGNPHYHQATDLLETVNQQLVTEVGKVTAATLALLASAPARLTGVAWQAGTGSPESGTLTWDPARESRISRYRVRYASTSGEEVERELEWSPGSPESRPSLSIDDLRPGALARVRAVRTGGLEGWDWGSPP